MSTLSRWSGIVAIGALAVMLLVSAWHHIGNGAYFRLVVCLVIAILCMCIAYSEIVAALKAKGVIQ